MPGASTRTWARLHYVPPVRHRDPEHPRVHGHHVAPDTPRCRCSPEHPRARGHDRSGSASRPTSPEHPRARARRPTAGVGGRSLRSRNIHAHVGTTRLVSRSTTPLLEHPRVRGHDTSCDMLARIRKEHPRVREHDPAVVLVTEVASRNIHVYAGTTVSRRRLTQETLGTSTRTWARHGVDDASNCGKRNIHADVGERLHDRERRPER